MSRGCRAVFISPQIAVVPRTSASPRQGCWRNAGRLLFVLGANMKEIPLTQGKVALVDDADYEWLVQWKWYARKGRRTWYAIRGINKKHLSMHRELLGATTGSVVDHKDGNGLNNQRDNIRLATYTQNRANSPKSRVNTSGYKGVIWQKRGSRWRCVIYWQRRNIHIGMFSDKIEAAKAYDEAAKKYHGEFASLNFPTEVTT